MAVAAEAITTEVIVNCTNWLHTDMSEDVLIIDCRPFMVFNAGHINSAQNAHCPPIIKRRSGGALSLAHIIRCPRTRNKLITGEFRAVVVYDESTTNLSELSENDNMKLVLKSLCEDAGTQNVYYLVGGYMYFKNQFPQLCDVPLFAMLPHAVTNLVDLTNLDSIDPSVISCPSHPLNRRQLTCDTVKYHPSDDQGEPVEMLPWLYLGNAFHATQETCLMNLNISALLNVCSSLDRPKNDSPFVYKKIPIDDNSTADVMQWFPDAIQYIEHVREGQGKVLVHCEAGISRSATICIAYLMCYKRWTLECAYDFVKSRRNLIAPNLNFMQQLHQFEMQIFGSSSVEAPPSLVTAEDFHLPLTPCSTQACVFQFESPHSGSPTTPYVSPLISPS